MPKLVEAGIDWICHAPNAPRTGKGSRTRKNGEAAHLFSPAPRLQRTPFSRKTKIKISPVFRRTPTGRRRYRKDSLEPATSADAVADAVPLAMRNSFDAALEAAASSSAKTPAPKPRQEPLSDARSTSAKTPAPFTPAPPQPAGEAGLKTWLKEAGLERVYGLLDCLLFWREGALDSLDKLRDAPNEEVLEAIAPLKLKGIKLRKMLAALETLRGEASAFAPNRVPDFEWRDGQMERPLEAPLDLDTSVTRLTMADMPPPPRPRIGDLRMPANPEPPRFKPRTMAELSEVPAEPEEAAVTLGLTGPSEAKELAEIAELFGTGSQPSARPANTRAAATAAKAAMNAAAKAMEAAAIASEQVVVEAQAKARRQAMGVEEATPRSIAAAEALAMDLKHVLDEASSTQLPSETDDELAAAAASKKGGDSARGTKKKRATKKVAKTLYDENEKENIGPTASNLMPNQQQPRSNQPIAAKPKFDMSTLANAKPLGSQSSARSSASSTRSSQRAVVSSKGLASRGRAI